MRNGTFGDFLTFVSGQRCALQSMSADKQQQNIFVADYLLGKIHVFDAALGYVGAWYGIFGVISPTAFNLLLSLMLAVGSRDDIGMLDSGLG